MENGNKKSPLTTRLWVVILATTSCFLWGSAFPSLKYSYEVLSLKNVHFSYDLQFAGYRFLISSIVVLLFILFARIDIRIKAEDVPKVITLGLLQTTILYFFFYIGLSNTSGVKGSIINSTGTLFSVMLPHFFFEDDKMNMRKAIGLIFGLSGIIIISMSKGTLDSGFKLMGEGFLVISAFVTALSNIYAKKVTSLMNPVVMNFYALLSGSLIMILISYMFTGGNVINLTPSFMPMMIYLGFISGAAFTMWYLLLKVNDVSRIAIHKFQIPIWGAILSAMFIKGEGFTLTSLFSLLLVCIGIVIVSTNISFIRKTSKG
jgi:drug/metabolite transporter (DMT)-like permease